MGKFLCRNWLYALVSLCVSLCLWNVSETLSLDHVLDPTEYPKVKVTGAQVR